MSLVVATYMWFDPKWQHNDKFIYGPQHVRWLKDSVKKHLSVPHEFAVITDRPGLFKHDKDIRAIRLDWTTHVPGRCYVRLFTFHPKGAEIFGEQLLQLDLDCSPVGEMAPLVERDEDLVLWKNPARRPWKTPESYKGRAYYNTSILLHRCGTLPDIFTKFDPVITPQIAKDDQWLLSSLFDYEASIWDESDGIYRLARKDTPGSGIDGDLPDNARIVMWPGDKGKPWLPEVQARCPWVKAGEHYWEPEPFQSLRLSHALR